MPCVETRYDYLSAMPEMECGLKHIIDLESGNFAAINIGEVDCVAETESPFSLRFPLILGVTIDSDVD